MPNKRSIFKNQSGIGILELLISLCIFSVLTYLTYFYYQHVNIRTRDAARIADLANLQQAITLALTNNKNENSNILCNSLTRACSGSTFPLNSTTQKTDGEGWVKVNISKEGTLHLSHLPVDPVNNITYHYEYAATRQMWELTAKLESAEYKNKMVGDGGNDPNTYEVVINLEGK